MTIEEAIRLAFARWMAEGIEAWIDAFCTSEGEEDGTATA